MIVFGLDFLTLKTDLAEALADLAQKPVASTLSALGIAIGVAALVAMLSIGEGAKEEALKQIVSLGMNTIRLEDSLRQVLQQDRQQANISQGMTEGDIAFLGSWLQKRAKLAWYYRRDDVAAFGSRREISVTALGVSSLWPDIEGVSIAQGRALSELDAQGVRRCLIGSAVASKLFLGVGDSLRLVEELCIVIGVLAPKGSLLTEGTGLSTLNFDRSVILPIKAFGGLQESRRFQGVIVKVTAVEESAILAFSAELEQLLRRRHRDVLDVRVVAPIALLKKARDTQRLFSSVMGAIAGLTLLVGGVGIMNIMLANISEQTREIALRRAVGADARRILSLYLSHSCLLTGLGSLAGIVLGVVLALIVQAAAGWVVAFSVFGITIGPVFALCVGLLFGYYPASRASRLNVAAALREA